MLRRTFVRRNLYNSDRTPENIPQGSTQLDNEIFDRTSERLRTHHKNELPHPMSQNLVKDSPCEIGYVKSGYDVRTFLLKGGVVCLVDDYQALTHNGKDVIQKQMVLFHENSAGLESLCEEVFGFSSRNSSFFKKFSELRRKTAKRTGVWKR